MSQLPGTTVPTALTGAEQLKNRISELQEQLQTGTPGYEGLLHVIHSSLSKDEELVHFLSEDEIGIIVSGLTKNKNMILVAEAVKKRTTKKELSTLGVGDF